MIGVRKKQFLRGQASTTWFLENIVCLPHLLYAVQYCIYLVSTCYREMFNGTPILNKYKERSKYDNDATEKKNYHTREACCDRRGHLPSKNSYFCRKAQPSSRSLERVVHSSLLHMGESHWSWRAWRSKCVPTRACASGWQIVGTGWGTGAHVWRKMCTMTVKVDVHKARSTLHNSNTYMIKYLLCALVTVLYFVEECVVHDVHIVNICIMAVDKLRSLFHVLDIIDRWVFVNAFTTDHHFISLQ